MATEEKKQADQQDSKLKAFLKKQNIEISAKRYFIDAMGAMAQGLFASLLIGTIIGTLGDHHIPGGVHGLLIILPLRKNMARPMTGRQSLYTDNRFFIREAQIVLADVLRSLRDTVSADVHRSIHLSERLIRGP